MGIATSENARYSSTLQVHPQRCLLPRPITTHRPSLLCPVEKSTSSLSSLALPRFADFADFSPLNQVPRLKEGVKYYNPV